MGPRARAVALCALMMVCAQAAGFTVDCNHEYADCESELSKMREDEDLSNKKIADFETTTPSLPTRSTSSSPKLDEIQNLEQVNEHMDTASEIPLKPNPRLLNINDDIQFANVLHNYTENHKKVIGDLSDVTLDEDEEVLKTVIAEPKHNKISDKFYTNLQAPFHTLLAMEKSDEVSDMCKENNILYKIGDRVEHGCEEVCMCAVSGMFECEPRCKHPYIRKSRRLNDPLCFESPVDECCSIITCAGNGETKPAVLDVCIYDNDTHPVGAKWNVGCEKICECEKNSVVSCKPRCNPLPQSDRCINVQNPHDACCEMQVCDVSQDVHEEPMDNSTSINANTTNLTSTTEADKLLENFDATTKKSMIRPLVLTEPIGSIKVLQNNSVQVNLIHLNSSRDPIHLLLSEDGGVTFKDVMLEYSNLILDLQGGKDYILKTRETDTKFNFTITASDEHHVKSDTSMIKNETDMIGCYEDGKFYAVGSEFHIGCTQLCECTGPEERECAALECPAQVGLELVWRGCVHWAPSPPATLPACCPRAARCLSDGTCHYKDVAIPNWTEVPISLTGCEKRCFCENGELDCQEVCTPLPELPPQSFRCPLLHHPAPVNVSDDDCCKQWGCVPNGRDTVSTQTQKPFLPTVLPDQHFSEEENDDTKQKHQPSEPSDPELPILPLRPSENNMKLTVLNLQADSPTSVKMLFGLPPVLVGLRGNVDLRYTDKPDEDIANWSSQVFAPAKEILTTARLEFRLTGLKPSTMYNILAKLYLHNLPVEPESEVFSIRTKDLPTLELPEKSKEIDSRLTVLDVNDTTALVNWRHFTEEELEYIDGIQVRYRPVGTPIYIMTELLHHSRSSALLQELRPDSKYEASLVLIPPPRATVELHDPATVEFNTSPSVDPYNWTVSIEARTVGSGAAQVTWRGVPAPPERWVRVYRASHACDGSAPRTEDDAFRLAARDLPPLVTLTGLKPNTRCRVWLELFLTNGKVKTSNVLEINTKSLDSPEPLDNEVVTADSRSGGRGDYYGALVAVGVVAALGALTSLLLLLVVARRHRPRSVPITSVPSAPRESSLPPYDNPAFKLELQQETMDL